MSFYLNAINGGNTIGPLICGKSFYRTKQSVY
jgi:hypothetical protein